MSLVSQHYVAWRQPGKGNIGEKDDDSGVCAPVRPNKGGQKLSNRVTELRFHSSYYYFGCVPPSDFNYTKTCGILKSIVNTYLFLKILLLKSSEVVKTIVGSVCVSVYI
jgi:hypothetical protein